MGLIAVAGSDLQIREGAVMHPDPEIRWGFLEICFRPFRPQFGPKLTRRRGPAAKKMRPGQCTNPSRESWDDLSGDQYIICLKPPSPAGKILDRRQLFFLANHNSLEQTPHTRQNLPPQDSRDGFFLYTAQASFSWPHVDLARLLRRACSRSFWIISFEFVKVCGIRFSI